MCLRDFRLCAQARLHAAEAAQQVATEGWKASKRDAMKFEGKFLEVQKSLQAVERTNAVDI